MQDKYLHLVDTMSRWSCGPMWQESGQNTFSIYVKTDLMHKTFSYSHLNLQCKERTELNTIKNWKPLLFLDVLYYFILFFANFICCSKSRNERRFQRNKKNYFKLPISRKKIKLYKNNSSTIKLEMPKWTELFIESPH